MQLPFARQSSGYDSLREFSGERLVNLYARPFPDGGVGPFILVPSPGLTDREKSSVTASVVEVVTSETTGSYALFGTSVANLITNTAYSLGTAVPDLRGTMVETKTNEVAIASLGDYFTFDGSTVASPTTGAITNVGSVAWMDGYTILSEDEGARIQISALNDPSTFNALDFATAENNSDDIIRIIAHYGELWVFGTKSTEVWQNTGNADFPFAPIQGAQIPLGLRFRRGVVSTLQGLFGIGNDKIVYRFALGAQPQKISSPWVDHVLEDYTAELADVAMFSYTYEGHTMVVVRLPDAPALIYDTATGLWHERSSDGISGAWEARCAAYQPGGLDLIGCHAGATAQLGGLSDLGETLTRYAVSLPVDRARERFTVNELQMNFKTGATNLASDASVSVEVSWDGGNTWSTARTGNLGDATDYDQLIRFRRFGSGRTFRARFTITDPIETALYGVTLKIG